MYVQFSITLEKQLSSIKIGGSAINVVSKNTASRMRVQTKMYYVKSHDYEIGAIGHGLIYLKKLLNLDLSCFELQM